MLNHHHGLFFLRAFPALQELITEKLRGPINEIRGHVTVASLRDWINENSAGMPAVARCAVRLNRPKKIFSAFLLDEQGNCLFAADGRRLVWICRARTLDDGLRRLFGSKNLFVINLKT